MGGDGDYSRLDKLGAHFKFQDMFARLQRVVNEQRQEKRSYELLMYQAHFSKNDPEI